MGKRRQLTAQQLDFLDLYFKDPRNSLIDCAKALGIPVNTVYGWKEKNVSGFRDEMDERLRQRWDDIKVKATVALDDLIAEHNFQAVKYGLDYHGYSAPVRVEADVNSNININIVGDEENG